ncbi:hypothetical protein [Luteimonas vadosa]|uniref:DUF3311 domain-containing protein n=1 Tax=Luteimonas vadosa TaxID=1165507 RepID=A0ABP9DTL5_9GAMM
MLQAVAGVFVVALVAVVSLPQARGFHAGIGWIPFWLLALPASAWCALWAARRDALAEAGASAEPVGAQPPRRRTLAQARRRGVAAPRTPRRAHAA